MSEKPKYYITGGAGFIGSSLCKFLNNRDIIPIIIEPLESIGAKWKNLADCDFVLCDIVDFNPSTCQKYDILINLGANVITTEEFSHSLWYNNVKRTIYIFKYFPGKIIHASSASVYGVEENVFDESRFDYTPLNPYAFTKYQLDKLVFRQDAIDEKKKYVCALRFFNVYGGANERCKGSMSSVIFKWLIDKGIGEPDKYGGYVNGKYNPIKLKLFKSNNPLYKDGEQMRDFIYIEDVCKVIYWLCQDTNFKSGIYNLGSGQASTWNEVAKHVLAARGLTSDLIEYIPMPENLVNQYQYRTCADLTKLRAIGYKEEMTSLEDGIKLTNSIINK